MAWLRESKWVTGGLIVSLMITGAMSITSYQNSVQLVNSANQVWQTSDLLDALTDISVTLADAESRLWSYLLFNNPDDLEQYHQVVNRLDPVLDQLRQPLSDTFIQQERLTALENLIHRQLLIFEAAIAHHQSQGAGISNGSILGIVSANNLDQIRQVIADLEATEEEIIALKIDAVSTNSRVRMVIEPVGSILTFVMLFSVFATLYQQLQKRQQAEAIQRSLTQEKELGELKLRLFSMVSHEFRTPLSLILGSSQLLEEGLKDKIEPHRLKNLYRIKTSAKIMTQLLNDILTLARADAGELRFSPKWTEIQTFCLNLIEDFQISYPVKRSLAFTQKGDRTHVYVDERLLYSILSNLISNAAKFSPENSTIHVILSSQSDSITFQVRDEGMGIPSEDQPRLYDPFSRGSNAKEIGGTGLGLAVVQKCLALHGGAISVSSQVGVGTTFTVTIPQLSTP